jgi:hypothetical protein
MVFGRVTYEDVSKIFRTGAAIYTAVVVARSTVDGRTTMSSESVCKVARSWVDVDSFPTRLVVRFMNFYSDSPEYFGYSLAHCEVSHFLVCYNIGVFYEGEITTFFYL